MKERLALLNTASLFCLLPSVLVPIKPYFFSASQVCRASNGWIVHWGTYIVSAERGWGWWGWRRHLRIFFSPLPVRQTHTLSTRWLDSTELKEASHYIFFVHVVHILKNGNLVTKWLRCAVGTAIYECAWASLYYDSLVPHRLGHCPAVWQQMARELSGRQRQSPLPPSLGPPSKPWWCGKWARRTWSLTGAFSHDGSCTAAVVHRSQYDHILSVTEDGIVPLQTKTFTLCRFWTNIVPLCRRAVEIHSGDCI